MIKTIAIVGAGTMGADIAHLAAQSGFEVMLYDIDSQKAGEAFASIQKKMNADVEKGRLDINMVAEISSKIKVYRDLKAMAAGDLVIECVYEDEELKQNIFKQLDSMCRPEAILASNTSSISITKIANATKRPESVIGIHFLIPARVNKLVEIIPGFLTTRETVETIKSVLKKMGKTFVESKDYPGFLLNRMVFPMVNEAVFLLYEGAGTAESIDRVMKTGLNLPMGPLALADLIGLDIVLAVADEMYRGFSDPKYRPCPLLRQYVSAGFLGRKSGRGFYRY